MRLLICAIVLVVTLNLCSVEGHNKLSSPKLHHHPIDGKVNGEVDDFIKSILNFMGRDGVKDMVNNIKKGVQTEATCLGIEFLLTIGKKMIKSEETFETAMRTVCEIAQEKKVICVGIGSLFAPVTFEIISKSKLTPTEMAVILAGDSCLSDSAFDKSIFNWNIQLPPPTNQSLHLRTQSASPFKFLHLTDVHLDLDYVKGAKTQCDLPLCCRNSTPGTIFDINSEGDYGEQDAMCDAPLKLATNTMDNVKQMLIQENITTLFWTGDIVPHDVWQTSKQEMIQHMETWSDLMRTHIPAGVKVFPLVGNHEAFPVNMFSPPEITGNYSSRWIFEELWSQWKGFLPKETEETFKAGGFYSAPLSDQVQIIAINTVYCDRGGNYWNLYNPVDLGGQLSFLAKELAKAESAKKTVLILGHNPPTLGCSSTWIHNYINIIHRFQHVIKGSFFGHTHKDEMYVYFKKGSLSPSGSSLVGGSVTTYDRVNPCFKVYSADGDGSLLDQETFYLDIPEANMETSPPVWKSLYKSTDAYGVKDLSTFELYQLTLNMLENKALREEYFMNYHRDSSSPTWAGADEETKQGTINDIIVESPLPKFQ